MVGRGLAICFSMSRPAAISGAASQYGRWPMPSPATWALALARMSGTRDLDTAKLYGQRVAGIAARLRG